MLVTSQAVIDLSAEFNQDFQAAFAVRGPQSLWMEKAYRVPSSARKGVYSWVADQPDMRKWYGERVIHNFVSRSVELENEDWEYTFEVDRKDIEYDNLGVYADRGRIAGDVAGRWYDKVVTDAMIAGTTTLCFDGQYFYDTDHPVNFDVSSAGTYSNKLTTRPLTADNVWYACAQMMSYKGESGRVLEINPGVLEVPPQLGKKAMEAVSSPIGAAVIKNVAGTENVAAAGITNAIQGLLKVVINPRLASQPTVWYVHSVDRLKPFVMQVAKDPTPLIARIDPAGDPSFHRKKFEFGTEAAGNAMGTLPVLSIYCDET
jgi:phage major head subunit gpT-like protein